MHAPKWKAIYFVTSKITVTKIILEKNKTTPNFTCRFLVCQDKYLAFSFLSTVRLEVCPPPLESSSSNIDPRKIRTLKWISQGASLKVMESARRLTDCFLSLGYYSDMNPEDWPGETPFCPPLEQQGKAGWKYPTSLRFKTTLSMSESFKWPFESSGFKLNSFFATYMDSSDILTTWKLPIVNNIPNKTMITSPNIFPLLLLTPTLK